MRGLRRGRGKSSPQEEPDSPTSTDSEPVGTGAVTLVGESHPPGNDTPAGGIEPASIPEASTKAPVAPAASSPTPMKETISEVATAHAELDNVLPPSSGKIPEAPVKAAPSDRVSDTPVAPVVETPQPKKEPVVETVVAPPPVETPAPVEIPHAPTPDPATEAEAEVPAEAPAAPVIDPPPPAISETETDSPERQAQAASGNPLPRVLAVANQKGGVGKTTTSVNLGAALAEIGFRVLVIDLDPQGNATTGLGIDARNFEISMYDVLMRDSSLEDCVEPTSMKNLFVAPATIALAGAEIELVPAFSRELKLKKSIESIIDDFDYVLIDCPPSLGLITVNALAAADEVLVPIQCEYYALEGLSQLMRNVHLVASNLNPKLDISTIVLTMYDARTKLSDQVANEVRLHFGTKVCRNVIPRTVRLSEAPSFGQPITAFDPASRGAIAYRELAKEVSGGTS